MLPKVTVFLFIYLTNLPNRQCFVTDLGVNSSESSGPNGHQGQGHDAPIDPAISYECTAGKHITLLPTGDIPLVKLSVLNNDGSGQACKLKKTVIDICDHVAGEPVTLLWQDDVNTEVIGGQNSKTFHLSCMDEGMFTVQSAPSGLEVKPLPTAISFSKPVTHTITLSLKDKNGVDLGTSINIGQEIQMIMEITDTNYVISPETCTAKGSGSNSYQIWGIANTCSHDSSIIADKWTGVKAQTKLTIIMYGFYFPTSTHVTIECQTKVCTTEHVSACHNDCLTLNRRRRRDAPTSKNDTFVYKRSVQVSFDVAVNEAGGVNSAFATLPTKPVYGLMGITLYTMMQLT